MGDILEYKCPCCGGIIEFDTASQKMKCPYCDTEFEFEALKGYDEALKSDLGDSMEWDNASENGWSDEEAESMGVFTCKSCGGELVSDSNTAASACPYCGNPVVFTGRLSGDLKPDYVIPFKLDKKAAEDALKKHYKGKRLLPKIFKDENRIKEIKGIYVPFWLFDAEPDAAIRYRATKVRSWSTSDYIYTETRHFSVLREGSIGFQNVPVDGSSKIADDLMESIEPYNFSEAVDFQTAYLSGFLADRYDVGSEESKPRANERIKHSTEEAFASTVVGYTSVRPESSSVRFGHGKVKYVLYPVWILNTAWEGKNYTFAMNGQTGKFVGDLPLDKKAYWKWFFMLTGICSAAAGLLLFLFSLL